MKNAAFFLLLAVAAALVGATLLPFVETKWWLIRLLDFPRVLFGIGLTAILVLLLPFARHMAKATIVAAGAAVLVALATNAAVLWPYRPNGDAVTAACPAERTLSVLIANVQLGDRDATDLLQTVAAQKPDLFLAMEIDDWWKGALRPVEADMPFTAGKITGSYYGIRFFSRLPLVAPAILAFADRDTPSVVAGVTLRNGETVSFIGMHPKPPLPGQSSSGRDAELYAAGQMLRDRPGPALLAGDLNAVPWEQAVTRMRRIAGLDDPRRGYGYVAS